MKISFFSTQRSPYYVYAPDYRPSSAGIRALHYLCHFLNECGYEAYITSKLTRAGLRTPELDGKILRDHFLSGRNPVVIYPEVYSGNPLRMATVARWLLNKPGHLSGDKTFPESELLFYYAPWVLPPGMQAQHLRVPTLDVRIFNNIDNEFDRQRQGFCYYANKFLAFGGRIPDEIRKHGISLGQENRLSRKEIASHLRRAKAIYCFEQTALITEARACGCPVLLVPTDYNPASEWTDVPGGTALSTDGKPLARLQDELRDFPQEMQLELSLTEQMVLQFIERTQQAAAQQLAGGAVQPDKEDPAHLWTLPAAERRRHLDTFKQVYRADYPDIDSQSKVFFEDEDGLGMAAPPAQRSFDQWLGARQITPKAQASVDEHLQSTGHSPFFHIFVIGQPAEHEATRATLRSLEQQAYRYFKASPAADSATAFQAANDGASGLQETWFVFVEAGTVFLSAGLLKVALEIAGVPDTRALYADEMVQADAAPAEPLLRPDFNLDMLLSCPAGMARHWFFRSSVLRKAGGFDAGYGEAAALELLMRLVETEGIAGLHHVHEPLLTARAPTLASQEYEMRALRKHLLARGYADASIDAVLPGRYRIRYGHPAQPLVSIIIPSKDQFPLLERCVSSLLEKTAYSHYEILLVDNGSAEAAAQSWLDGLAGLGDPRIRVLRYPAPFNFSAMNNLAASEARGDYLLLLNNDTAVIRGDWLDALLNHAQRPEVGVVGAKLLHANGKVQHAGLLLGLYGTAGQPFVGLDANAQGYMHRLEIDQNYGAVSAACMMVRRSLYEELGGMDAAAFPFTYADWDLCLRARSAGYLTVWTPHSVLLHEGGASQPLVPTEEQQRQHDRSLEILHERWLPALAHDPAYNRNLSLHATFAVDTEAGTEWNPHMWRPQPVVLAYAADTAGCGHYRVIEPVRAMHESGIADARFSGRYFTLEELERLQPDTMVLQRQVTEQQIELIQRVQRLRPTFMVAELDDYLPNLPMKNAHRHEMPKDVLRHLRRSVSLMDRFVVSTPALAEAFAGFHSDMRVVQNRLPPRWWRGLQSSRRAGARPRVGWAGGISHQGDLELIVDVVKALHGEVDWIFFGMAPEAIKPYLREFHGPVSIERYPRTLASLNLDLALAPLEQNLFNECKSNLRLLEYGACGYPVVCSDVRPYQGGLPVTRVKNRFKDWVDAIRMHTQDLDAAAATGDRLKAAVESDWMLEGANLQDWLANWLPDGAAGSQK